MRLLVLGGTVFVGRAVARRARDLGHEVVCAARGRSGAPPDGVRFVPVDRGDPAGWAGLAGETFDAVVDVARRPSYVRSAVAALGDRVGHWVFVSTCSVYADQATPRQRVATAPLLPPAPPEVDDAEREYGPCKVACEQALLAGVGADRLLVCRAGLIVGPEDPSGRFTYWVRRLARGGEVLAPGDPAEEVQLVDVRDLAAWLVGCAEQRLAGTYDGMGAPMPRGRFLAEAAAGVSGAGPAAAAPPLAITWVAQDFLLAAGVRPWSGERSLPLWLPVPEYAGFLSRDVTATLRAGLRTRPLAETAADTRAWLAGAPAEGGSGLSAADEADLLRRWHARAA
ncbi:MAG TPA: NAD-dependent epimerase/dehydratase family protein [Pilimelia sp.]|nr:NAD-dependent epimerase/dehydratase family protein [Pilimelia sp.]